MMCPYCLAQNSIKYDKKSRNYLCSNPECLIKVVPREYATNITIKNVVVSAVGFRGHGKTNYFASLFYILNQLAGIWDRFYTLAIDEESLKTIKKNIVYLEKGELPLPTPVNFPKPTIVRFSNIPIFGDRFFLFYDTGGEAFDRASTLIKFASFVKRARTVMFVISLEDLENPANKEMHNLLQIYVQGLTELEGNTEDQHLLIVFSKGGVKFGNILKMGV